MKVQIQTDKYTTEAGLHPSIHWVNILKSHLAEVKQTNKKHKV